MKTSSAFKETEDEDEFEYDDGNDCEEGEPPGIPFEVGRGTPFLRLQLSSNSSSI
jgi:hypothetical protein